MRASGLKTRFAVIVSLFMLITAVLVGLVFYLGIDKYASQQKLDDFEHQINTHGLVLNSKLRMFKEDLQYLIATPPIQGLVRADQHNGKDPVDKSSLQQWRDRLGIIFSQYLKSKPVYTQIRLIKADDAAEIVRAHKEHGEVEIVPEGNLQKKKGREYVKNTLALKKGQIYISNIELNRENGVISQPYAPVIRVASPVYGDNGVLFGLVVINIDFTRALHDIEEISNLNKTVLTGGHDLYFTNSAGDYLIHPQRDKSFAFEFGEPLRIQEDFPVFARFFSMDLSDDNTVSSARFETTVGDRNKVAYFSKIYFDELNTERFFGVAIVVDYERMVAPLRVLRNDSVLLTILLVLLGSASAVFIATLLTRNISDIANAVFRYGNGETDLAIPVNTTDEVGLLARSFNSMIRKVNERDRQLRENQQQFSSIVSLAEEGIISIDDNHRIVLFNLSAEKIFGYKSEEITGKDLSLLLPQYSKQKHQGLVAEFERSGVASRKIGSVERNGLEITGMTKSGKSVPLEATVSQAVVDGKKIFTTILRDVSGKKKEEIRLRISMDRLSQAQEVASMGSFVWNSEAMEMDWSDGMFNVLGYDSHRDLPSLQKIMDRVHDEDIPFFNAEVERVFKSNKSVDIKVRSSLQHNGSDRQFHVCIQPWKPEEAFGHDLSRDKAIGIIQDITELYRAEQDKQELQKQLQQSQKMEAIGQLTGGIAHDFNNILASIMGYTSLARERFARDNEKLSSYLSEVETAGGRARDLISQMLTFSRGGSSEPCTLQMRVVVKDSLKLLASTIPSSIMVKSHYENDLPKVLLDPVQLQQLVMNLCINARDSIQGSGEIDIRVYTSDPVDDAVCIACKQQIQTDNVVLEIKDSGSGIDSVLLDRIFDPFFSTKAVGKGTGMGLSMVHGIVHEHGGHIQVDSQPGEGSTFRLYFPAVSAEKISTEAEVDNKKIQQLPSELPVKNYRVLVVDDERTVAGFLKELLGSKGYDVVIETDSERAVSLFERDPYSFNAVITDQTMPKLTGVELAKKLFKVRSEIPIILCTGFSEEVDEKLAFDIGIHAYLDKPVNPSQLCQLLSRLIKENLSLFKHEESNVV